MSVEGTSDRPQRASAWALGGAALAASMLIMIGIFQVIQGLAAIINDDFFVGVQDYAFEIDLTAWGWVHLIIGVIMVLAGFYLLSGSTVASGIAIGLALLSAVANFFFIPYYPFWSLLIIALCVFVIWSIVRVNESANPIRPDNYGEKGRV